MALLRRKPMLTPRSGALFRWHPGARRWKRRLLLVGRASSDQGRFEALGRI
jgi:hypothetical protein